MADSLSLDIVICTYNRAADLDRVLAALTQQRGADAVAWSVLVVDNNSTDGTAAVVEAHQAKARLPGLRRILETEQGLTPARRAGVRATSGEWIAFVDDDNLLEPDWIAALAEAIADHPRAGGFGGRVLLDWALPRPHFLDTFGFCFAAQDQGDEPCELENLAGAGMVLRRAALEATGWLEHPLLADRVGARLVSGGDVEIGQRIRGAGFALRYAPRCVLRHRISASRMRRLYVVRIAEGLGASSTMVNALGWPGDYGDWLNQVRANNFDLTWWAVGRFLMALARRRGVTAAVVWLAFAHGANRGVRMVRAMKPFRRSALLGAAAPRLPQPEPLAG